MPVIKPRTRCKQLVRHITRLDRENVDVLYAYAQFIGEPTDYILNQAIENVLGKDKEYLAWRATHPESYMPPPSASSSSGGPETRTDRREGAGATTAPVAR